MGSALFDVWVDVWVLPRPSPRPKLVSIEKVKKKAQILSDLSLFGGDYRTRICDLLRVNAGRKLFPIVYNAFWLFSLIFIYSIALFVRINSEYSMRVCGQLCGQN